eukprot:764690-Prymnesium_polylepis.1
MSSAFRLAARSLAAASATASCPRGLGGAFLGCAAAGAAEGAAGAAPSGFRRALATCAGIVVNLARSPPSRPSPWSR